ncbi:MAG: ATP phosphoribosyltransferase regulatory subunit [Clostridia bacterium]|nr:ATP phosphoribosyltransferase regulatory subunit [Clostridia bacterium]
MQLDSSVLKNDEKAVFALRSLYAKHGYSQYKMNKFEEYDLYVRNKDFLVSDNIITFTDTSGRLLALKPDVTLSIIKNGTDIPGVVEKVYYDENVYRVSRGTHAFREIRQVGLECIGDIDDCCITEVLSMAADSLALISDTWVLDVSHLGILSGVLNASGLSENGRKNVLACIGEKNRHGIADICAAEGINEEKTALLTALVSLYGTPDDVLAKLGELLKPLGENSDAMLALRQLEKITAALPQSEKIHIDFSVTGNMSYYSGVVFKGFIAGIPDGVLSGGQYDKLMKKMQRRAGALGFAVYLDLLERMNSEQPAYDVDILLLYDADTDPVKLRDTVRLLASNGSQVLTQKAVPEKIRYKQLLRLNEKGVEILENHA